MRKRRYLLLGLLAAVLVITASIGPASAYFTTYTRAVGGFPIHLGDKTEIREEYSNWTKHLVIRADDDSEPVFVRARAFWGEGCDAEYVPGAGWSQGGDGWWYYDPHLNAGEETADLQIRITPPDPEGLEEGDSFRVAVVYETAPVRYRADGSVYADWSEKLIVRETAGTEGGDR